MIRIIVALFATYNASGQAPLPRFEDYPVTKVFTGIPAAPILDTPEKRMFRTRIRDGVAKGVGVTREGVEQPGPNLAGHYIIVEWAFGSPGVMMAMVDAVSGRIYSIPLSVGLMQHGFARGDPPCPKWWGPGAVEYRRNSRLFTVEGPPNLSKEQVNYKSFFLWENHRWVLVKRVPLTCPP